MYLSLVEIEILREQGRREGADCFQGCTPQSGNHIDGKSQRDEGEEQTGDGDMRHLAVAGELDLSQQVDAQQCKNDDPQHQEHLPVEYAPAVCQVGDGEELERQRQLEESQHHLHRVEPSTRFGHACQPGGEDGEEHKRYGQRDGKS